MIRPSLFTFALAVCGVLPVTAGDAPPPQKSVAIIGAGPGGATTAYFLKQLAAAAGADVHITVFESNDDVGGRASTAYVFDDPSHPIELGASVIGESNALLYGAVKSFGLSTRSPADFSGSTRTGVWDGTKFRYIIEGIGPWNDLKLDTTYGTDPKNIASLQGILGRGLAGFYSAPAFPWTSLTSAVESLGLLEFSNSTGSDYLLKHNISSNYVDDVVQGAARVNYCQNVHDMNAVVALAISGRPGGEGIAITGGNKQLFGALVAESGAELLLEHRVREVRYSAEDQNWSVKAFSPSRTGSGSKARKFDEVVIAAPLALANITIKPDLVSPPPQVDYLRLHVTIFASPYRIPPSRFNATALPDNIQTTLAEDEAHGVEGVGSGHWFYALLQFRIIDQPIQPDPRTGQRLRTEYVYKIFSPAAVPDERIRNDLLGLDASQAVSWTYRHIVDAYPKQRPVATFAETKLAPGLWYTSGIEALLSAMEFSALSGKNVATQIVNGWKS